MPQPTRIASLAHEMAGFTLAVMEIRSLGAFPSETRQVDGLVAMCAWLGPLPASIVSDSIMLSRAGYNKMVDGIFACASKSNVNKIGIR